VRLWVLNLLFLPLFASAAIVTGKITDQQGEPLPFVNVYVKNTSRGTISNIQGEYKLDLPEGNYELVFKSIGYKSKNEIITVASEKLILNVTLPEETYISIEVPVLGDGEDPAYAIIRNAIKKRKYYLEQVNAFSCDVYIKGVQKVTKYPKKIMGLEIDPEGDIDTTTGIVYLSESVSKFNFKQPDKIREEMISSKVSGDNRAFSYNRASDMMFNFYENVILVSELSERGFVSPINSNAFLYYKYKMSGTFYENGEMVNKIEVIPKSKTSPCFHGYIYIMENTWRIHSTELYLTKDAQIDFVDTLVINQVFYPVQKDTWMVLSNKFTFNFSVLGIKGNGMFIGVNSNYIIDPDFPKKYFNGEEMKINEDANKKDTTYWTDTRPVPLTPEEIKDYHKRDSLQKIRTSKPYLDSVDKVTNKPTLGKLLLTGYTYSQRYKKRSLTISPLILNVQYNTVQGWVAGLALNMDKELEKNRNYTIGASYFYGFAAEQHNATLGYSRTYNPIRYGRFSMQAGMTTAQFNENNPIGPLINSLYSLLYEQNFAKYYRKTFFRAENDFEIRNGLMLRLSAEYDDRAPLLNHTTQRWIDQPWRFTSNDPHDPDNYILPSFANSQQLKFNATLRIRFKQKYYTRPNQKIILGSKYPTFIISYTKAIPGVLGSDADYDLVKITVRDEVKLKLLGTTSFNVSAGTFLSKKSMDFMDFYHFSGNQTLYSSFVLTNFNLLDYYEHSTNGAFVEAHLEHGFGGLFLNKVPLLRKLKLKEVAGIHYISTETLPQYLEVFVGLEKLRLVRVDFVTAFSSNIKVSSGIRFGLKLN
jgi:hypothetical protein